MSYEDLESRERIRKHDLPAGAVKARVREMLKVLQRHLDDASLAGISIDGLHNHAYDAARTAAEMVMTAEGYRKGTGPDQHVMVFEFLGEVEEGRFRDFADRFEQARKLRNKTQYDLSGIISASTANAVLKHATAFAEQVRQWLTEAYPELLPEAPLSLPNDIRPRDEEVEHDPERDDRADAQD